MTTDSKLSELFIELFSKTTKKSHDEMYMSLIDTVFDQYNITINTVSKCHENYHEFVDMITRRDPEKVYSSGKSLTELEIEFHENPEESLKSWYTRQTGRLLNLSNAQTYNEKIQIEKINNVSELKTKLSDKILVRDHVREIIGSEYLSMILGIFKRPEDIDFDTLPDKFVIKANHGAGFNIIVQDKSIINKESIISQLNDWLSKDYSYICGFEMHYQNIDRKIYIEEYFENEKGDLFDYKFVCFNGNVEYVWVDRGRYGNHTRDIFDKSWNLEPYEIHCANNVITEPKPEQLDLLIELSEKLSTGFNHARVDFYILNDGSIKFGEITFHSQSGAFKWYPRSTDLLWGSKMAIVNNFRKYRML